MEKHNFNKNNKNRKTLRRFSGNQKRITTYYKKMIIAMAALVAAVAIIICTKIFPGGGISPTPGKTGDTSKDLTAYFDMENREEKNPDILTELTDNNTDKNEDENNRSSTGETTDNIDNGNNKDNGNNIDDTERTSLFGSTDSDNGGFVGYDEVGNVIYMEIKEGTGSDKTIAGIKPGDEAYYAAEMLEKSGATADMAAQQYWAEFYYNEGRTDTFALVYSYPLPDKNEVIVYMVTIEKDKVIAVSAEKK